MAPIVTINRRLCDASVSPGAVIAATVPAARVDELGAAVLRLSGLFGVAQTETLDAFSYVLPEGRTYGKGRPSAGSRVVGYNDPQVRGPRGRRS